MKKLLYPFCICVALLSSLFSKAQSYCTPVPSSAGLYINSMDFSQVGFTSGANYTTTYGGYTQTVGSSSGTIQRLMQAGIFSSLSNTSTTTSYAIGAVKYKVYADWNKDGDFSDADETLFDGANTTAIAAKAATNGFATFSFYFTIPVTAQTGSIRLRFAMRQNAGTADACGTYPGEVEDYIITVQGNTAPVLDNSATPLIASITDAQTANDGFTVTQLINSTLPASTMITEADYLNSSSPFGIAVTATTATAGSWQYKLDGGSWTSFGAVSSANSLLLSSDGLTRIRFVPSGAGTASFTFRAWDQTTGNNGGYANTTTNGGTSAYSTATETASIDVISASSAPSTKIFFATTSSSATDNILRSSMNKGSAAVYMPEAVVASSANLTAATDLVYDPATSKIVWAESTTVDKIVSANPDGTGVTVLLSSGMSAPNGIAVGAGKIFITDNGNKALYRINSDGTGFTQISGGAGQLATPNTLKDIEYYNNNIYFISRPLSSGDWKIVKANTDGSSPTELFSFPTQPYGLSVADGVVYWTEYASGNSYLKSGPTSGGGGTGTLLLTSNGRMYRDLEADATASKLYIIDIQGSSAQTYDRALWTTSLTGTGLSKALTLSDSYSSFALETSGVTLLPVTVVSFTAKSEGEGVKLEWKTEEEVNNSHFVVERSGNGKDFYTVGKVQGSGTPLGSSYSFYDAAPIRGENFYRLKQVDNDGGYSYTEVRKVNIGNKKTSARVYPNPVTGSSFTVEVSKEVADVVSYRILNAAGFTVKKGTLENRLETIDAGALKAGVYILQLSSGEVIKIDRK